VSGFSWTDKIRIVTPSPAALPAHYELTSAQLICSAASIGAAFLLLGWFGYRIAAQVDLLHWWVPVTALGGVAAADFVSGLIHWGADTWGRDDCAIIGRRLLLPFRVHHVNPDDFLRRRFIDTNGDVAFVAIPVLMGFLAIPLETAWGPPVAVWGLGFCGIGSMTNQIHQWAHMQDPPRAVRLLQSCRLLLGGQEHSAHHQKPYDGHYCITTGWCNRPLEALGFFRRLEYAITRLTGVAPRHDDERYEARFGI
jgi:ubiquitin-conjugating enzyme E2 variant